MMSKRNKTVKLVALIFVAALLSSNVFALNSLKSNFTKALKLEVPERMVKNLAIGIASDNLGVKRSCIYFAGYYEIEGLVEPLSEQLAKESDSNTRIFIALALYKIGSPEAIKAVEKLSKNDVDSKVKRIAHAILNEFQYKYLNGENITKN